MRHGQIRTTKLAPKLDKLTVTMHDLPVVDTTTELRTSRDSHYELVGSVLGLILGFKLGLTRVNGDRERSATRQITLATQKIARCSELLGSCPRK